MEVALPLTEPTAAPAPAATSAAQNMLNVFVRNEKIAQISWEAAPTGVEPETPRVDPTSTRAQEATPSPADCVALGRLPPTRERTQVLAFASPGAAVEAIAKLCATVPAGEVSLAERGVRGWWLSDGGRGLRGWHKERLADGGSCSIECLRVALQYHMDGRLWEISKPIGVHPLL